MKKKCDSYEIMLKKFFELMKDEWTPAPQTETKFDEEQVEKINEDVKENFMVITIGKTNVTNDSSTLKIVLMIEGKSVINEFTNISGTRFNYKTELDLMSVIKGPGAIDNFVKNGLILELLSKACFACPLSTNGEMRVPFAELGLKSELVQMYTFPKTDHKVEVN